MRMFTQLVVVFVGAAVAFSCSTALGQAPGGERGKGAGDVKKPSALAQQLDKRFEAAAPQVGEALTEVQGYDAEGREVNLQSLKGNYTVIVFGCLT